MLSMHKKDATVPDLFTELTNKQPWTLFHQDNDSTWTYKEVSMYGGDVLQGLSFFLSVVIQGK